MSLTPAQEQRVNLKFLVKLGKGGKEALQMLREAYGPDTMGRSTFYHWFNRFKEGREDVTDNDRSGRPTTVKTEVNVATVGALVKQNKGLSFRQIGKMTNISHQSVRQIVRETLKIRHTPVAKKETKSPQKRTRKRKGKTSTQANEGRTQSSDHARQRSSEKFHNDQPSTSQSSAQPDNDGKHSSDQSGQFQPLERPDFNEESVSRQVDLAIQDQLQQLASTYTYVPANPPKKRKGDASELSTSDPLGQLDTARQVPRDEQQTSYVHSFYGPTNQP